MTQLDDNKKALAWRTFIESYSTVMPRLEDQMMKDENLPLNWYDVLSKLINFTPDGRLRMLNLASMVFLVTPTGLTRVLDKMEAAGLVTRSVTAGDRRGVDVAVTEEGRKVLERVNRSHSPAIEELFLTHMTDDEAEVLVKVFSRVLRAIKGPDVVTVPGAD